MEREPVTTTAPIEITESITIATTVAPNEPTMPNTTIITDTTTPPNHNSHSRNT